MRKLQTSDVFSAMRLIRKANLREEIKPFVKLAASGEFGVEDIGIEGIIGLVELFAEAHMEQSIYYLLSGPFEMEPQEIAAMEPMLLIKNLQELAEVSDIKSFFTALVGLISEK